MEFEWANHNIRNLGIPPRVNKVYEVASKPADDVEFDIGLLGEVVFPRLYLEALRIKKPHPRALPCVAVGINLNTSLGIRIEYRDPKKKINRRTTVDCTSVTWQHIMAYGWRRRGLDHYRAANRPEMLELTKDPDSDSDSSGESDGDDDVEPLEESELGNNDYFPEDDDQKVDEEADRKAAHEQEKEHGNGTKIHR